MPGASAFHFWRTMTSSATTTAAKPTAADPKAAADEGADLPPGLLDVCSLVLPFFDSAEVARLGSTSKTWSETTTASSLPLVLRRELVTSRALPDRLVMSIDEMEGESLGHWRRFAQQWASKTFVRADLGTIDAVAPPAKDDDDKEEVRLHKRKNNVCSILIDVILTNLTCSFTTFHCFYSRLPRMLSLISRSSRSPR